MDKNVLKNRLDAIEVLCDVNDAGDPDDKWIVSIEGYVRLPTRRVRELVKLARIGLEHSRDGDFE